MIKYLLFKKNLIKKNFNIKILLIFIALFYFNYNNKN